MSIVAGASRTLSYVNCPLASTTSSGSLPLQSKNTGLVIDSSSSDGYSNLDCCYGDCVQGGGAGILCSYDPSGGTLQNSYDAGPQNSACVDTPDVPLTRAASTARH